MRKKVPARFRTDITRRDGHRADAQRPAGDGHIDGVFQKHHRVVVGERHTFAAVHSGALCDFFGACLLVEAVELFGFGDIPVLTEATGKIATRSAEGQNRGAGQEVVERFFFDRIDAKPAGAAISLEDNLAIFPTPHKAKPPLPFSQLAGPGANIALQAAIRQPMPIFG